MRTTTENWHCPSCRFRVIPAIRANALSGMTSATLWARHNAPRFVAAPYLNRAAMVTSHALRADTRARRRCPSTNGRPCRYPGSARSSAPLRIGSGRRPTAPDGGSAAGRVPQIADAEATGKSSTDGALRDQPCTSLWSLPSTRRGGPRTASVRSRVRLSVAPRSQVRPPGLTKLPGRPAGENRGNTSQGVRA
jgi:hypothetical protein